MTQFHEGRDVEVHYPFSRSNEATWPWCKAKIVFAKSNSDYVVQFPDGTRGVFDAAHIRPATYARSSFQELSPSEQKANLKAAFEEHGIPWPGDSP